MELPTVNANPPTKGINGFSIGANCTVRGMKRKKAGTIDLVCVNNP